LVVFPAVRDDFGVAVGGEAVAAAFQLRLHLGVVEQLAVEDDGDAAVLVEDGLATVGKADDAEPPRREGQAGPFQIAVLVRPAVKDGVGHAHDRPHRGRPPLPRQIDDSRDAAHQVIPWRRVQEAYSRRTRRAMRASTSRGKKRLNRNIQRASRPSTVSAWPRRSAWRTLRATPSTGRP